MNRCETQHDETTKTGRTHWAHSSLVLPRGWRKVSSLLGQRAPWCTQYFVEQVRTLLSRPMPCTDPLPSALAIHFALAVQA